MDIREGVHDTKKQTKKHLIGLALQIRVLLNPGILSIFFSSIQGLMCLQFLKIALSLTFPNLPQTKQYPAKHPYLQSRHKQACTQAANKSLERPVQSLSAKPAGCPTQTPLLSSTPGRTNSSGWASGPRTGLRPPARRQRGRAWRRKGPARSLRGRSTEGPLLPPGPGFSTLEL